MSYGTATVVLRHLEQGSTVDELGNATLTPVDVSAKGCRHRPLTFQETVDYELDIATEWWRTTLPLEEYRSSTISAILALRPNDVILVNDVKYQIQAGARPFDDFEGKPFKATILSKRQTG